MFSPRLHSDSLAEGLRKGPFLAASLGLAAIAACYVGPLDSAGIGANGTNPNPTNDGGTGGGNGTGGSTGTTPGANNGIPCDVDALLGKRCRSCHVQGGASPMPLVTYEDLTAPSKSDASKSVAVKVLERMRSEASPLPPSGERASATEIGAMEAWVAAKTPRGECGASAGPDGGTAGPATPAPVVCTSGQKWTSSSEGPKMNPGRACISCHEKQEDDPVVWAGGTVYPTLHEENGCYGIAGGATVVITDAKGRIVELPVGPTGNFSLNAKESAPLAMPIRAKVVRNGVERAMSTPQNSADCNGCHTEQGANGAPGRILVP